MFKTMSFVKNLVLIIVILLTVSSIPTEIPPKFCDVDYIDAVLWDGIHYRIIHEQWIADYDERTRTVGDFYHKNKTNLKIEEFYQFEYNITEIPECQHLSHFNCTEMKKLKGLKVTGIRSNRTNQLIGKIERQNKSVELPYGWKQIRIFTQYSNRFLTSFYSPKEFKILMIANYERKDSIAFNRITWFRQLSKITGPTKWDNYTQINVTERVYTGFWWKFDNKTYVITETAGDPRFGFIKEVSFADTSISMVSIEKTLNGFFGCFQEIETNSPITSTITPTKTSSEKTTTESPQSFPLWLIVITVLIVGILIMIIIGLIIVLFSVSKQKEENKGKTKKSKKDKEKERLSKMLKKFEMEAKSRDSQPVKEPSFQTIGFEPNETPIGSLKDPIPIPPKTYELNQS